MALLSFQDRITDLAGSLGTADDNALQQWLIDGCYDVITKVTNIASPMEFAIKSSSYSASMDVSITDIRDIIQVERDNITCKPLDIRKRHLYENPDSLYLLTDDDPGFYILNNKLTVKPNPTADKKAYYTYIPEYSIDSFTGTSSINNFPNQYYEHVILYAAIKTLDRQLLDLLTNTDITAAITAAKDAITKSSEYMDSTGATTTNVVGWLNDEDSEMAGTVMSAVSAELSTSQASATEVKLRMSHDLQSYQWNQERRDNLQKEYFSKFPQPAQGGK